MKSLSLRVKVILFLVMISLIYSTGFIFIIYNLHIINKNSNNIFSDTKIIYDLRLYTMDKFNNTAKNAHIVNSVYLYALSPEIFNDQNRLNESIKFAESNHKEMIESMELVEKKYKDFNITKPEDFTAYYENYNIWINNVLRVKTLIQRKNIRAARELYYSKNYLNSFTTMLETLTSLSNQTKIESKKLYDHIDKDYSSSINLAKTIKRVIIVSSIILLIFTIFFSIILGYILVGYINKLKKRVIDIAQGEGDLTTKLEVTSKDEVGELAKNLNFFIEKLRIMVINIKNSSKNNLNIKDELAASTEQTLAALTEISSNIDSITSQVTNLNNYIESSSASINQISMNISSLDNQIEAQTSAVSESSASVTQMIASINNVADITKRKKESTDRLVETAKRGGDKINSTSGIIENITKSVDDILEMINLINQVASQTDLLSMNAAIEAAHAGEAGKSFAVVADEIRKLAESTSESAKDISNVLQEVVDNIKLASNASTESQVAFDDIDKDVKDVALALEEVSSSASELATGGGQIIQAMTLLSDTSIKVKDGSTEMKKGVDDINQSITDIKDISFQVKNGLNEILEGIREITDSMNNVSELGNKLGETGEKLNHEINKFRTDVNEKIVHSTENDEQNDKFDDEESIYNHSFEENLEKNNKLDTDEVIEEINSSDIEDLNTNEVDIKKTEIIDDTTIIE